MILSCEYCDGSFERRGKDAHKARFCSRKCKSDASGSRNKDCEICGGNFRARGARAATARFCSLKCKGIASRKTFNCETCGADSYGYDNINKRWCSRSCASAARRTGEDRNCKQCGMSFYVPRSRIDAGARFCSHDCHNEYQGRNKTEHECKTCGNTFRWSPSRSSSGNYRITYCSMGCRDADPARREMLVRMQAIQQSGKMTKTEALGYAMLDSAGVEYERQLPFAMKFTPDAVIPTARLVVQFDGDYWHDRAGDSTEPRIMRRVALDRSQDKYVRACGWEVVRFWDSELRDNPELCRERLTQFLVRPLGDVPERDPLARA